MFFFFGGGGGGGGLPGSAQCSWAAIFKIACVCLCLCLCRICVSLRVCVRCVFALPAITQTIDRRYILALREPCPTHDAARELAVPVASKREASSHPSQRVSATGALIPSSRLPPFSFPEPGAFGSPIDVTRRWVCVPLTHCFWLELLAVCSSVLLEPCPCH